ncbi:MAG TPA: hypothetical protein VG452_00075, partial [Egibacteraceae bacterium]|nr:hypothetical protein [Egibacteraceae bacterium]
MIVISMVLVIVAAVTLVIGVFFSAGSNDLSLIYVSIGSCLLAGLFLILGVLRQRPRRKALLETGPAGQPAPWQPGQTQPLQAEPTQAQPAQDWYEQRRTSRPAASVLDREEPAGTTAPVAPRRQAQQDSSEATE